MCADQIPKSMEKVSLRASTRHRHCGYQAMQGVTSSNRCTFASRLQRENSAAGATDSEVRIWTQRHSTHWSMRICQYSWLAFYVGWGMMGMMGMGDAMKDDRNFNISVALWIERLRLWTLPIQWTLAFERDQNCESRPGAASTYGKMTSHNPITSLIKFSPEIFFDIHHIAALMILMGAKISKNHAAWPRKKPWPATRWLNVRRPHRDRERSLLCWTRWTRWTTKASPKRTESWRFWCGNHQIFQVWVKPFSQFGSAKLVIFSMRCTETSFESWLDPYAYHPLLVPWRRHRLSRVREEAPWAAWASLDFKEMNIRKKTRENISKHHNCLKS